MSFKWLCGFSEPLKALDQGLVEREENKIVDQMPIRIYSYSMDDRSYTVQSSCRFDRNFKVETQMTQSEVERFKEDWRNLWNPKLKCPHL